MTFVPLFDIPVFWPILLAYFVFLLVGGPAPSIEARRAESDTASLSLTYICVLCSEVTCAL